MYIHIKMKEKIDEFIYDYIRVHNYHDHSQLDDIE